MNTIKLTPSLEIIGRALDRERNADIDRLHVQLVHRVRQLECDLSATAPEYHDAIKAAHAEFKKRAEAEIEAVFLPEVPF